MNTQHSVQKPGWIARILLTVTTLALVVVGFFFFTVALVVGAIIALIIGVRFWWILRKLKRAHGDLQSASTHAAGTSVVDGEYQVVERESGAQPLPPGQQGAERRNDTGTTENR
jgi:uncharacterized protein HemY